MTEVDLETVVIPQGPDQVVGDGGGRVDDTSAGTAHQVDVLRDVSGVIGEGTVAKVGVRHEAEVLEQLNRAVHRRGVDRVPALLEIRVDLLRCGMDERIDRVEDLASGQGQPVATSAEFVL
jgi:hypothetical protein